MEAKGKGKGNGKGQGDGGKGKGHKGKGQENATNLSPIPQPVFCKRCDHMNQPGTYWCIKTGCGGLCAKAKVPGGGDTSQDLTKQEKEAMQKADEWIQDNEENQEDYEDMDADDEEGSEEAEEQRTLQDKVECMRSTMEDMIARELPKEAIDITKAKLKELEQKLRIGPITSIAEIQGAKARRETRYQRSQGDRERRIEEVKEKIQKIKEDKKAAMELNKQIFDAANLAAEAHYAEQEQKAKERAALLRDNIKEAERKHQETMMKMEEKLAAITEDGSLLKGGGGETAQIAAPAKQREEEGILKGTTIPEGTAFVTSHNVNESTIANAMNNDALLQGADPQLRQAFLSMMTKMMNSCGIISQATPEQQQQAAAASTASASQTQHIRLTPRATGEAGGVNRFGRSRARENSEDEDSGSSEGEESVAGRGAQFQSTKKKKKSGAQKQKEQRQRQQEAAALAQVEQQRAAAAAAAATAAQQAQQAAFQAAMQNQPGGF